MLLFETFSVFRYLIPVFSLPGRVFSIFFRFAIIRNFCKISFKWISTFKIWFDYYSSFCICVSDFSIFNYPKKTTFRIIGPVVIFKDFKQFICTLVNS